MNRYFSKLNKDYQDYFKMYGFEPENDFEADAFFRSVNNITKDASFKMELPKPIKVNGAEQSVFVINKNNFLDAFYPAIWQHLDMKQMMLSINFAFENMIQSDAELAKTKPKLLFGFSTAAYIGAKQYEMNNKQIVEFPVSEILMSESSIKLLKTLRHEVYHAQQSIKTKKQLSKIAANNERGISNENLTDHELSMLSPIGTGIFAKLNDFVIETEALDIFLPRHPEYSHISMWNKIKSYNSWDILLSIPYLLEDIEKGAFDKQKSYAKTVKKYFEQKFGFNNVQDELLDLECDVDFSMQMLNTHFGFNLDQDSLEQFKKLNQIVSCDIKKNPFGEYYFNNNNLTSPQFFKSAMWFGIKYMLQVYKTKTTLPIPDALVEHFKNKKIDALNEDISWLK